MAQTFPLEEYISVRLSEDKLYAYLQFKKSDDQFRCTLDDLNEFLKSHGVVYGLHYEKLAQIANEPKQYFYDQIVIATGDKPKDGEDGKIQFNYAFNGKTRTPIEKEDGTVDYKNILQLNNVRKGQLIAERILPKEGVAGKAVTGDVIVPKKGKEVHFKVGKNVVTDPERMKLYATIDGLVTFTDRDRINVFPIYEVNGDVDYRVGNIDFVGTVIVRGNVLTGFRIKASGDIRVIGGVEGAELIAEGSIEVTAGILAHNKGKVVAGKDIKSSFIQDANIEAGEDVIVSQSIMHSHVKAGKNVICQGSKGLIVGGIIQAGEKVVARTVGNTMSTPTVIEVGVLPNLRNELIELREKTKTEQENLIKTEKALAILDQLASAGKLTSDKMEMRSRLTSTKKQMTEEIESMKERILEIEKSLESIVNASIEVQGVVYGGTKIVIGRYTRYIKDSFQRTIFRIVDGEIAILSI